MMAKSTFWDSVLDCISGIAWRVFLWSSRMTEEEFIAEHERQAIEKYKNT